MRKLDSELVLGGPSGMDFGEVHVGRETVEEPIQLLLLRLTTASKLMRQIKVECVVGL